ncbi:MAG: dihydrolipoyl dehydrogenase [Melioribacteraceae bacterium]|nr:dihydrolipoyl dehydrogenase [Melioribacteraceae bacterium]
MIDKKYDLIIIGAGPGGYLAAERAGARGKKVLIIEKEKTLGGVCLNKGCIPTKTLLNSAKIFYKAQHSEMYGVTVSDAKYDFEKAIAWKSKVVNLMTKGVAYKMKSNNVTTLYGEAKFVDKNRVSVNSELYSGDNIIIATGSSPIAIPIEGVEQPHVITSDEVFNIAEPPQNLVIIGGGVIGLEFASYFSMIGVNVAVLEMLPEVLPNVDSEIAKLLRTSLSDCNILTNVKAQRIEKDKVVYIKDGNEANCDADLVLLATGRAPNVERLGLENINIEFSKNGINVNDKMETNIPNVFAVGDVTGKSLLAHSAYRMGEVAVNTILGASDKMRYNAVPWVVYTNPELSGIGLTEVQAKKEGYTIKVSTMQLRANGRFYAEHGNEKGIVKAIVDADTDLLLGLFILGGVSSEVIHSAAIIIEAELRVKDIKEIIFPHPTVSEAIKDVLWEI